MCRDRGNRLFQLILESLWTTGTQSWQTGASWGKTSFNPVNFKHSQSLLPLGVAATLDFSEPFSELRKLRQPSIGDWRLTIGEHRRLDGKQLQTSQLGKQPITAVNQG